MEYGDWLTPLKPQLRGLRFYTDAVREMRLLDQPYRWHGGAADCVLGAQSNLFSYVVQLMMLMRWTDERRTTPRHYMYLN